MAEHLNTGAWGEDAAVEHLRGLGYAILERNWRSGQLEIDIIARHDEYLVFVEVKTRVSGERGTPQEAVGRTKQRRLTAAATQYLSSHDLWESPCRFDIIAVTKTAGGLNLEHMENAFEAAADAGGHAAWQPW
ncbi:MAG: YraN family protein [Desulfovibrio sp.]|nr:MAG: YraN family protein [Desulfovibrio sp.]